MQDADFIAQFQAGSLKEFSHQDHVKMGWLYLQRFPILDAIAKFSADLKNFAQAKGAPNLYHETITWAYLLLSHERMQKHLEDSWEKFCADHPDLLRRQNGILKQYYQDETLTSDEARRYFRMPDKNLPL